MIVKKAEDELSQLDKYASPDTIPIFEVITLNSPFYFVVFKNKN